MFAAAADAGHRPSRVLSKGRPSARCVHTRGAIIAPGRERPPPASATCEVDEVNGHNENVAPQDDSWWFLDRVLSLTLATVSRSLAGLLPAYIPGAPMEGSDACWVFEEERPCPWCGGHAGLYRPTGPARGRLGFCLDCWSLDAFRPDGGRLRRASHSYSKLMSGLPEGAHVTAVTLRGGAVKGFEWNTDPPDEDKYDSYYAYGRKDYGIATVEFLKLIETEGYLESYFRIGEMCAMGGAGLAQDWATAFEWVRMGAELGHEACQVQVGLMYEMGRGVEEDLAQALSWYRRASAAGFEQADERLGLLYYLGKGVDKDLAEARRLWKGVLDHQPLEPNCGFSMGHLCYHGHAGPRDLETAFQCFWSASLRGHEVADLYLGLMYVLGEGVEQNYGLARHHFQLAAEQGVRPALGNLGRMYWEGLGVPKDNSRAEDLFLKAAGQGEAKASLCLGGLYAEPGWPGHDRARAEEWYLKAVELGETEACYGLGMLHAGPVDRTEDAPTASFYLRLGAERGDGRCLRYLAWYYSEATPIPRDLVQAHVFLARAARNGDEHARSRLAKLEGRMSRAQLRKAMGEVG